MDLLIWARFVFILHLPFFSLLSIGVNGATFTFVNKCDYTVWPGILANAGSPRLDSTGFELPTGTSRSFQAPTGWSGRFWGRTGCKFDGSASGYCATGDCGSGQAECDGAGAAPPATLAEFTLGTGGQDFYDVSLVDGYNLPVLVDVSGGSGQCASTGCVVDLNQACPAELKVGNSEACKSACEAFGSPEYCCSGTYGSPATCKPSVYSQMFKSACPRSYSYAYDDATSTFTCAGADYTITFCPSTPSQKSARDPTPVSTPTTPTLTTPPEATGSTGSETTPPTLTTPPDATGSAGSETPNTEPGSDPGPVDMSYGSATNTGSGLGSGTEYGSGQQATTTAMVQNESWLVGLAMGDSTTPQPALIFSFGLFFIFFLFL